MQAAKTNPIPQSQIPTQAPSDVTPAFVYLFDQTIDPNSIQFCRRLGKISRLNTPVIEFTTAKAAIASVSENLGLCNDKSNHLLLHVHGHCTGNKGQRTHRFSAGVGNERDHSTREWLENLLLKNPATSQSCPNKERPFIHVLSCEAKALADEIKPGTPLWQSGWFILYSSSKTTSLNHLGYSLKVTASYLELCEANEVPADPLTMFYLAGMARGDCMTLLGGDLQQPLTLHAPKSLRDLTHAHSIKLADGSASDKARILLAGIELSREERSLLPDADDEYLMSQLLATRLQRKDKEAIKKLVKNNSQLLNRPQLVGTLPLASAVNSNSLSMTRWMLEQGANINATDSDGNTVLFSAISLEDTFILKFLLEHQADPNWPKHETVTPLFIALDNDKTQAAELLIRYGADITIIDDGDTPLTLAVSKGQLSVVNCILEHSTDRSTGLSAELAQQARAAGQGDIALLLEQALQKRPDWKN
jgi:ankyrin repeat protein